MKTIYTICKGWDKPTQENILQTVTNKREARKEAKEWAAALAADVVVYANGDFYGVMEFPVYLRDICKGDTSAVVINFND